jgi:hypothetical protein
VHPLASAATAVVVLLIASPRARAGEQIPLTIDCAALDDEGRSVLEARARADLLLEPREDGSLSVSCRGESSSVTWLPADGRARTRVRHLPPDRPGIVDGLLEDLHAVLSETALGSPASQPADPSGFAAPTAPPAGAETARASVASAEVHRVRLAAGAHSELWSGAIGGAIGARGGVRLGLAGPWWLSLVAGANWGTTKASELEAWSLSTVLTLDRDFGEHVVVGAGLVGTVLWATGNAGAFTQRQLDGATAGAVLRAAYRAPLGPIELSIGPELDALMRPVIVQVGGQEVFRMPTLVAGFDVTASSR